VFGHPLTEQYIIGGTPVQYFERARFEWHAGTGGEADYVLLTRLGAEQRFAQTGRDVDPSAVPFEDDACIYEYETGHNICDEFAFHWVGTGGASIYGFPISEAHVEDGRHVQYFERSRFELQRRDDGSVDLVVAPLGSEAIAQILSSSDDDDGTAADD
jgi:hypothetical protein